MEQRGTVGCQPEPTQPKRWLIAAAALMQAAVGATYAWSVFRDPLAAERGWTISEVTLAYGLNLFSLGVFAFVGGLWMRQAGPRTVGITAGLLYGLGLIVAGLAGDRLWARYLGFGVVAGIGRGLAWVVPMAVVVKWSPDRRGLVSGVSLAGNGVGALVAAPLATGLIEQIGPAATPGRCPACQSGCDVRAVPPAVPHVPAQPGRRVPDHPVDEPPRELRPGGHRICGPGSDAMVARRRAPPAILDRGLVVAPRRFQLTLGREARDWFWLGVFSGLAIVHRWAGLVRSEATP